MKIRIFIIILSLLSAISVYPQLRDFRVHSRSMLHQTVFNTGEVGRAYDAGSTGIQGGYPPSLEWPPNGHEFIDRKEYEGQHNSMGGGVYLGVTRAGQRFFSLCGAVSTDKGTTTPVEGVYSYPVSVIRTENFPVLSDGLLNPAYNPDEAEEIIVSKWGTNSGITITRTSRAWSFPGYNGFIIYEYEFQNSTSDTLTDAFIGWAYSFAPSMFGYERKFNRWSEADYRNQAFGRFDLRRWMHYNHERNGRPDTVHFDSWSQEGDRGGLNSPQAVGLIILHYDYDHLADSGKTNLYVPDDEAAQVWDINHKLKQPYVMRQENGNLYFTKVISWMDYQVRKVAPFKNQADSLNFPDNNYYWLGRGKPYYKGSFTMPANHGTIFGPYTLAPGDVAKFTVAEVVGYGPGRASDTIYKDLGGSTFGSNETGSGMHPVPSWYNEISYPEVQNPNRMGSNYLQSHHLPWYVDPEVVSIRDAADRAIQLYTGQPLIKWDSLQFEPKTTPEKGFYNTIKIPVPAPIIKVENTNAALNKIIWGPQVESFNTPRLNAPFSHYLVMRAIKPLGPWTLIDSVDKKDIRYFLDSVYVVTDYKSSDSAAVYYAVYSVDVTGRKSGFTNMTPLIHPSGISHNDTNLPDKFILSQNYPNPFNPSTKISYNIPKDGYVVLKIYNIMGKEVKTLINTFQKAGGYNCSFDASGLSSGVYFYSLTSENFHSSKKMILIK